MVLSGRPSVPLTVTIMCAIVSGAVMLLAFASAAHADQHGGGTTAATITAASSVSPSASATASATTSATASATSLPTSGGAMFDPALSLLALLAVLTLAVSGVAARVLWRSGDPS